MLIDVFHGTKWRGGAVAPLIAAAAAAAAGNLPGSCSREAVAVIVINIQISRVLNIQHNIYGPPGHGTSSEINAFLY